MKPSASKNHCPWIQTDVGSVCSLKNRNKLESINLSGWQVSIGLQLWKEEAFDKSYKMTGKRALLPGQGLRNLPLHVLIALSTSLQHPPPGFASTSLPPNHSLCTCNPWVRDDYTFWSRNWTESLALTLLTHLHLLPPWLTMCWNTKTTTIKWSRATPELKRTVNRMNICCTKCIQY